MDKITLRVYDNDELIKSNIWDSSFRNVPNRNMISGSNNHMEYSLGIYNFELRSGSDIDKFISDLSQFIYKADWKDYDILHDANLVICVREGKISQYKKPIEIIKQNNSYKVNYKNIFCRDNTNLSVGSTIKILKYDNEYCRIFYLNKSYDICTDFLFNFIIGGQLIKINNMADQVDKMINQVLEGTDPNSIIIEYTKEKWDDVKDGILKVLDKYNVNNPKLVSTLSKFSPFGKFPSVDMLDSYIKSIMTIKNDKESIKQLKKLLSMDVFYPDDLDYKDSNQKVKNILSNKAYLVDSYNYDLMCDLVNNIL